MKVLKKYTLCGIIFVSILGTLLHFAYEWSGENVIVGLFTPINESIWEHTKLIFCPMLIYSLFSSRKVKKNYPCVSSAMALGSIHGVTLIITLFYTYSGIIGFHTSVIDISIFYISVITAFWLVHNLTLSCKVKNHNTFLRVLILMMICLYFIFTFVPPNIPLFTSP